MIVSDNVNLAAPQILLRAKWSSWNPLIMNNEQGRKTLFLGVVVEY